MDEGIATERWQTLSGEIHAELAAWRRAHPRATLTEIETVVRDALGRLQERYLQDLAHASPSATGEQLGGCPRCGGALQPRGTHERQVLVGGQAAPLRLRRPYAVCPACGAGLSPSMRNWASGRGA